MTAEASQSHLFNELADLARTLGSPQRLALLQHIAQGERSVERLAEVSGLSIGNASQHLQQLRRSNLVETRRDGKRIYYRLASGPIVELLGALTRLVQHNQAVIRAVVADSVAHRERLDSVSREELLARLREGGVTLLDVRPEDEFAMGHIAGAINIPLDALEDRLAEIPDDQEVVAYCRGPHCVLSSTAVERLRARGRRARPLSDGYPEWKAAGLSVETA